jgi:hypothetical protein
MMKTFHKILLITFYISCGFLLGGGYIYLSNENQLQMIENSKVVFLDWNSDAPYANLMSMSFDSSRLMKLGVGTGSIDSSTDGKFIATGCRDPEKICIYSTNFIRNSWVYPPMKESFTLLKQIDLPKECVQSIGVYGVNSISYSWDSNKLLVVCQNRQSSNICILEENGTSCWGLKEGEDKNIRADMSPINDQIVIDYENQINFYYENNRLVFTQSGQPMQIVNIDGKITQTLVDGWSPAWSPDGKRIAFFRWDNERNYSGLSIINSDGSGVRWIYRPPGRGTNKEDEYLKLTFEGSKDGCFRSSRVSWSQDQKFLVVEASAIDSCTYSLYRVEIRTGSVFPLTSNLSYSYHEPCVLQEYNE